MARAIIELWTIIVGRDFRQFPLVMRFFSSECFAFSFNEILLGSIDMWLEGEYFSGHLVYECLMFSLKRYINGLSFLL